MYSNTSLLLDFIIDWRSKISLFEVIGWTGLSYAHGHSCEKTDLTNRLLDTWLKQSGLNRYLPSSATNMFVACCLLFVGHHLFLLTFFPSFTWAKNHIFKLAASIDLIILWTNIIKLLSPSLSFPSPSSIQKVDCVDCVVTKKKKKSKEQESYSSWPFVGKMLVSWPISHRNFHLQLVSFQYIHLSKFPFFFYFLISRYLGSKIL